MERFEPQNSSLVKSAEYDEPTGQLTLTFQSGKSATYREVPRAVFGGLQSASSAGKYFADQIRGQFPSGATPTADGQPQA